MTDATKFESDKEEAVNNKSAETRKSLPVWVRITLKVLRVLLVPVLCAAALLIGMIVGYVKLGGSGMSDVFQWDTWKHLYDLVFAK